MTEPQPPRTLTSIKQYRLIREIGRGGMGTVYEGADNRDESRVAIKLLHPWLVAADSSYQERFEREAHIAALLRSPYTVRLVDFGVAEGFHYLVMEFVDGSSLADVLASGPLEPTRALRIAIDVARALEEAEARGIVHRDIKPANVLLTPDGSVKVADFGIARHAGGSGVTMAGTFVGTAEYAAPEQILGDSDTRSDIYSVGALLYCMLVGHPPFQAASVPEVLRLQQRAEPPAEPLAPFPASVVNPIRRCLEKDPRDRYQTPSELGGALERALAAYSRGGTQPPPRAAEPPSVPTAVAASLEDTVVPLASAATVLPHESPTAPRPATRPASSAGRAVAHEPAAAPPTSGRFRFIVVIAIAALGLAVATVVVLALRGGGSPSRPATPGSTATQGTNTGSPSVTAGASPTALRPTPTTVLPTPVLPGFPTLALPTGSPDREIIDTINRNGPAYADAINRRDDSLLSGVFTGDALARFIQEVRDEKAKPASESSLLSIELVTLQPSGATASVTTKELWRYRSGAACSDYSYDEAYQLTLVSGFWKVSRNDSVLTGTRACP